MENIIIIPCIAGYVSPVCLRLGFYIDRRQSDNDDGNGDGNWNS